MTLSLRIRKANFLDVPAIASLSGQLGYPATPSQVSIRLAQVLNKEDQALFVCEIDQEQVVGWLHIFSAQRVEVDPFAEIGGLVVDEAYRNQRIGKQLLKSAFQWAISKGIRTVRVRSNVIRTDAHRFYQREGFFIAKKQAIFEIVLHPSKENIPD